jgi:hypothetical protein
MTSPPPVPPPLLAPPFVPVPPIIAAPRPAVVKWYRLWCGFIAAIYVGMAVYGLLIVTGRIEPDLDLLTQIVVGKDSVLKQQAIAQEREDSVGVVVLSAVGTIFYIIAASVPRRRWGWILGMVALVLSGFPFVCTAAGLIPLVIFWGKPETKHYFGAG